MPKNVHSVHVRSCNIGELHLNCLNQWPNRPISTVLCQERRIHQMLKCKLSINFCLCHYINSSYRSLRDSLLFKFICRWLAHRLVTWLTEPTSGKQSQSEAIKTSRDWKKVVNFSSGINRPTIHPFSTFNMHLDVTSSSVFDFILYPSTCLTCLTCILREGWGVVWG